MTSANSFSASGGKTSSASRMNTHSFLKGRFSNAQFFFFGQIPLNSNCSTRAPCCSAIRAESSVLCESTTKISSAHCTDPRQRGRFADSLRIGTMTETGTLGFITKRESRPMDGEQRNFGWRDRARDEGSAIEQGEALRAKKVRDGFARITVEINDFNSLFLKEARRTV